MAIGSGTPVIIRPYHSMKIRCGGCFGFYDDEFEYNVSINAEKDTKFTYGSDGIEKKYW